MMRNWLPVICLGLLLFIAASCVKSEEEPGVKGAAASQKDAGTKALPAATAKAEDAKADADEAEGVAAYTSGEDEKWRAQREEMVRTQIEHRPAWRGEPVEDALVLKAMRKVPRHLFVPESRREFAYLRDGPLPIGHDQTISQPYIVGKMTELMGLKGGEKVLEVGTGSGYQAAVLAEICQDVYTIEILEPLAEGAARLLKKLDYQNVTVKCGDGFFGWEEHAPFDAVIVTCAPPKIPQPLKDQLKIGGRLVIPVGPQWTWQKLVVVTRTKTGFQEEFIFPVGFVPMTGEAQDPEKKD